MTLKISDIALLLNISEKTVYRWLKSGKIPAYKINGQYRFDKNEIDRWIIEKKINCSLIKPKTINLPNLIKKGGIYNISVKNTTNIINTIVDKIILPENIEKSFLISKLLEREELISTAIGNGIAVPHPIESIITNPENERVFLFINDKSVDYHALDGNPVNVFFLILATQSRHLEIIAKISFLSRDKEFIKLINEHQSHENILNFIIEKKKSWDKIIKKKKNFNL